jgi:hypothetical protein
MTVPPFLWSSLTVQSYFYFSTNYSDYLYGKPKA